MADPNLQKRGGGGQGGHSDHDKSERGGGGVGQPPGRPLKEPPLHSSSALHSNVLELYLK